MTKLRFKATNSSGILDLNNIKFEVRDQITTLSQISPDQLEATINQLLAGEPDSFYQTTEWDSLNREIPNNTHILVGETIYSYTCDQDFDDEEPDSFNWCIELQLD